MKQKLRSKSDPKLPSLWPCPPPIPCCWIPFPTPWTCWTWTYRRFLPVFHVLALRLQHADLDHHTHLQGHHLQQDQQETPWQPLYRDIFRNPHLANHGFKTLGKLQQTALNQGWMTVISRLWVNFISGLEGDQMLKTEELWAKYFMISTLLSWKKLFIDSCIEIFNFGKNINENTNIIFLMSFGPHEDNINLAGLNWGQP